MIARSIAEIKNQMLAEKVTQAALNGLTTPSQTGFWNLMLFIPAFAISIFEQLLSIFETEQIALSTQSVAVTIPYVYKRTLEFQYDATNVQNLQLNPVTLAIEYPNIIPAYKIITRCAAISNGAGFVTVKVAKQNPPIALSGLEKTSLEQYWNPVNTNSLGCAGINYIIISEESDKIEIVGEVFYNGQYSAVIQPNVIAAIKIYLANIQFSGTASVNGIEDAIQGVSGVRNVKISFIRIRRDSEAYGLGNTLYSLAGGVNGVQANTYAGYIEEELTAAHTFTDTLSFIAN